jgi:hypothetical protein
MEASFLVIRHAPEQREALASGLRLPPCFCAVRVTQREANRTDREETLLTSSQIPSSRFERCTATSACTTRSIGGQEEVSNQLVTRDDSVESKRKARMTYDEPPQDESRPLFGSLSIRDLSEQLRSLSPVRRELGERLYE